MAAERKSALLTETVVIERVVWASESRTIAQVRYADKIGGPFSALLAAGNVRPRQRWVICGEWRDDPRRGRQFHAAYATIAPPTSPGELDDFLLSGHAGEWTMDQVVALRDYPNRANIVAQFQSEPEAFIGLADITGDMMSGALAAIWAGAGMAETYATLHDWGLKPSQCDNLIKRFGCRTVEELSNDPYTPIFDVPRYGWTSADAVGRQLDIDPRDPRRVNAGIAYTVDSETWKSGNTWLREDAALALAATTLNLDDGDVADSFDARRTAGVLTYSGDRIYPTSLYEAENEIAAAVAGRLVEQDQAIGTPFVQACSDQALSAEQCMAVADALLRPLSLLTGGPGVGKTSTIKAMVGAALRRGLPVTLMAPTGKAAMRMTEATGHPASTIHRKLGLVPGSTHTDSEKEPLHGLVVVDEVSMLDTTVAAAVFRACADDCHLVLVGDFDQLPSVGPGAVLRDLLAFGLIPTTRLTRVYRNDAGIAINAARIRAGNDLLSLDDCRISECDDEREALDRIITLATQHWQEEPLVLTPTNKGAVGRYELNRVLQGVFNPGSGDEGFWLATRDESTGGETKQHIRRGDKVLVTKNDSQLGVFNGQCGRVVNLEGKSTIVVDLDGAEVAFRGENKYLLTLAYAITGHKSQGSEAPVVIVPVFPSRVLSREWLYTVMTRAKRQCYLVGDPAAISQAIRTVRIGERRTGLGTALEAAVQL